MANATWKKHPATGAWLVHAPGCSVGDSVTVVAASGKAKLVKLYGTALAPADVFGALLGSMYHSGHSACLFGEYTILKSNVPNAGVTSGEPSSYPPLVHPTKPKPTHVLSGTPKSVVKAKVLAQAKAHRFLAAAPTPHVVPPPLARTQKARGVKALAASDWQVPANAVLDAASPIALQANYGLPAFCRPCPMTPQHGFVDSRVVETTEQLEQVRQETLKRDPLGELMLMPFLSGKWSAIVTPAGLSIGPGHSAATAGHGEATSILLTDAVFKPELLAAAGVDPEGMPYCEIVESKGQAAVVQLRSGPAIPRARNYIPKQVPVCYVVDARPYDDLLEWKRVAEKLDASCTAVICSDLLCHQAAHCTSHGIAVVTDGRELQPGMVLKPEPMPPPDVQSFWEGLHYGMPHPDTSALVVALLALHQKQFMLQTAPGARLAGLACRTAVGIAAAACHGEARHRLEKGLARHQLFAERYPDAETDVHFLEEVFLRPIWGGSYGGKKWAACTIATVALRDAVRGCLSNPSQDAIHACFDALNMVVNVSHNGGLFLTKFGSTSHFDGAAQAKAKWIAQTACGAVWTALTESIALPCGKNRKVLRSEDPKSKPKVPRTYQARARDCGSGLRVQVILGMSHTENTFPTTPQITKAWEACKDNAFLPSLAGTGAMYVPGFIRGQTLYLKPKVGWYVTTGLELPVGMCPPTKKAKKAAKGG